MTNEIPTNRLTGYKGGNDTVDRCFVLSFDEMEMYLPTQAQRLGV